MHEVNLEHIQGHGMHGRDMHSLSQHVYLMIFINTNNDGA